MKDLGDYGSLARDDARVEFVKPSISASMSNALGFKRSLKLRGITSILFFSLVASLC
jgi:hypothetical protein